MPYITLWDEPFGDDYSEKPVGKNTPLPVINSDHQHIHNGQMFSLSGKASLAAGSTSYFLGVTNGSAVHFLAGAVKSTGTPCDVYLYENSTVSANGSPMSPINRNRNSDNISTLEVYSGPTVTGLGDFMEYGLITPNAKHGGGVADLFATEWILAHATNHIIYITNNDSQAVDIGYNFLWYEPGL